MSAPSSRSSPRPDSIMEMIKDHMVLLFTFLGVMWVVEIVDCLPYIDLDRFGIRPRSVPGLIGIPLAPFLHLGFGHLAVNSIPFVVLGGIVLLGGVKTFWKVTAFVTLVGGLGVWLIAGSYSNHLGASGLIFGYLGFLLARGVFEKSLSWMMVATGILFAYGSLLFGVLPIRAGVSWQGHLFGFLAGIAAARLMFRQGKTLLRGQSPPSSTR